MWLCLDLKSNVAGVLVPELPWGTGTRAGLFEAAVAGLIRSLGFDVEDQTRPISDAAGVIAISETCIALLAIECTGGDINNKRKLGGLVTRAKEIQAAERFSGLEVMSVLATSLEADNVPGAS